MRALAVAAVLVVLAPAVARAEPADASELGVPLPGPTALPALSSVSPYVMSFGVLHGAAPSIPLDNNTTSPAGSTNYLDVTVRSYVGSAAPGWFGMYSVGGGFGFAPGGGSHYATLELPSPGYGYRRGSVTVTAQLVPRIDWFSADVMTASGRDHFYGLGGDVQACGAYNFAGIWPRNSAACVYAAPVVYRDGWFPGVEFGVRWFAI